MMLSSDSITIRIDWNLVVNLMVALILVALLIWGLKWVLSLRKS